jgi:hypothetical protein
MTIMRRKPNSSSDRFELIMRVGRTPRANHQLGTALAGWVKSLGIGPETAFKSGLPVENDWDGASRTTKAFHSAYGCFR